MIPRVQNVDLRAQKREVDDQSRAPTSPRVRLYSPLRARGLRHIKLRAILGAIIVGLTHCASATDLFAGRVYTQPQKIYVNQPFELMIELEVSRGKEVDNIRIGGLPDNPDFITLGQLSQDKARETRRRPNGAAVDVLRFRSNSRCHRSFSRQFKPILTCDVIERRSRGFFSFSSSRTRRVKLSPFTLKIHKLPVASRPPDFSGAIGKFQLNGTLSKSAARPGDIITLSLELRGTGWLNNAPAPTPRKTDKFKRYPPKEILRKENQIISEQIFIPNSTNAIAIPAAEFNYFNPQTEQYEVCATAPFELEFITTAEVAHTNLVNVITTDQPTPLSTTPITISAREVNTVFHKILPIITACLTLLATFFVFLTLIKLNKWIAIAATLLTAATGTLLSFKAARYEPIKTLTVKGIAEVHLTPSLKSPLIMKLKNQTEVVPLESTERRTRIEAEGHRGWVVNSDLEE